MLINNKTFKEWTADDLRSLINNEDFRENQFIDYKGTFDFLEATDKLQKVKGKNEFRNDVCSFPDADRGNFIFWKSQKNAITSSIVPILIRNIDSFGLDLGNILLSIQPSAPNVEFNFITADDDYVVVVHIEKRFFKQYMIVENQTTFRFFIGHGNRKDAMSYSEISNSFLHSASLSEEIKRFRAERLAELLEDNTGMFGVIQIIPASFTNPADCISMFDFGKSGKLPLPVQLSNHIRGKMLPNVDGVWFPSEDGFRDFELLRIFNNGIVELKYNLYTRSYGNEEI